MTRLGRTLRLLLAGMLAVALLATVTAGSPFRAGADAPDPRPTEVVYVATGANYPDALGAGPAAALGNGPILLVQSDSVPSQTTAELDRLKPRLIVIVGGTAVVSTAVETTLKGLSFGPTVIRVAGSNRYATAATLSAEAFPCGEGMVNAGTDQGGPVCRSPLTGLWVLNTLDSGGNVGAFTSIAIDSFGNPVIAYEDVTNSALKLVHCNDPACTGGDEAIRTVDNAANVGRYTSLDLDAAGNPVIAYYDNSNGHLKLAHCVDPDCDSGTSIEIARSGGVGADFGMYASMVLDAAGNPVIAYYDHNEYDLELTHCNDPNCAGGDESHQAVEYSGDTGWYPSLVLDAVGNPVIAYYDTTVDRLKLAHCTDPNCAGTKSIQVVDPTPFAGDTPSLALDASGNPVIAYTAAAAVDLKMAHCNDPNCADGDESIETVDSTGDTGVYPSLVLTASGNPLIAYYFLEDGDLKLMKCNDPNCAGGDEETYTIDSFSTVGAYNSIALDAHGNPVIAYLDSGNGALKVASH